MLDLMKTCQRCHGLPAQMASKTSMNSRAGNLLAMFAMCFWKVVKKYIYKAFWKSDGKPGNHGKPFIRSCVQ
jgi:hypothetical protein